MAQPHERLCNDLLASLQALPFDAQWWITAPLPLKVAYFDLACAVLFGLAAAIAGIEFGREAKWWK